VKSWIFFLKIPGPGKVLQNHFGPGNSWKLKLKVLESPGKISLKVMHFSSVSNGKQAAIVEQPVCVDYCLLKIQCGMLMNFATFCFMLNFLQWATL